MSSADEMSMSSTDDMSEDLSDFSDDSDDDDGFDSVKSADDNSGVEEFKYKVLTPADLISTQLKAISEVNSVFEIPASSARTLLQHFNWEKEILMERYYDNSEKVFSSAGVIDPRKVPAKASKDLDELECSICCSPIDPKANKTYAMACDHTFCVDCWNGYLEAKIMEEGKSQGIECPDGTCHIHVDELTITRLLQTDKVKKKYELLAAKHFVSGNKRIRWCPAANCDNAIEVALVEARPVTCSCGHIYCFGCGLENHEPLTCSLIKRWLKKCADDSETANWISANTKECPKCKITVEKNGGCNHMVCVSDTCKHEYCWVCMGPWEPHGSQWYNCNRFNEDDGSSARNEQDKSRELLRRYLHYFERYANHEASLQKEEPLKAKVQLAMQEMQKHNMSWIEVQCMTKAVEVLSRCRTTLKYTYVFAFYLSKSHQAKIFEDNQCDLQMATEELSHFLEQDIDHKSENVQELKQKVLNKYLLCSQRCDALMAHVTEGYEQNYWVFDDPNDVWSISNNK